MNNIFRFTLVLFLVTFIASSVLSGVYNLTKGQIERQKILLEEEALRQVMPDKVGDRLELVEGGKEKYWKVYKGSNRKEVGYIFIAKKYGYSSVIETMVGMRSDGTITGARVLSQNETPGLGAKIIEVLSSETIVSALRNIFSKEKLSKEKILPYFTEQFVGKNVRGISLSADGIHAITGATISSKAVVESIRERGLEILK